LVDWVFNLTYLMSVSILVECIIVRQWHYHKTNVVESYEEEIRILKYSKDEVAPTSKHLKQKQKKEKKSNPITSLLARLLGEEVKKTKKTKQAEYESMPVEEQLIQLTIKSKVKTQKALTKIAKIEKYVFGIMLFLYFLSILIVTLTIACAPLPEPFYGVNND